jgi:hypothetical protein
MKNKRPPFTLVSPAGSPGHSTGREPGGEEAPNASKSEGLLSAKPLSEAYRRIGRLTPAQIRAFKPSTGWEEVALALFKTAVRGETAAAREIADRVEGRATEGR